MLDIYNKLRFNSCHANHNRSSPMLNRAIPHQYSERETDYQCFQKGWSQAFNRVHLPSTVHKVVLCP